MIQKINLCKRENKKYYIIGDARSHRLYGNVRQITKSHAKKVCKRIRIVKQK